MITRNAEGRIQLNVLKLQICIGGLLGECKNTKEVEWVAEQLRDYTDSLEEERIDEILRDEEEC